MITLDRIPKFKDGLEIDLYDWLYHKATLRTYFTEAEIRNALHISGYTFKDLAVSENFTVGHIRLSENTPSILESVEQKQIFTSGQRGKEELKTVEVCKVFIPNHFQSVTVLPRLLRIILAAKFEWFGEFIWDIYGSGFSSDQGEIYLNTPVGMVYVPLISLLNLDEVGIANRTVSYFRQYHIKDDAKFEDAIKALSTDTYAKFVQLLVNSF
jgi:hypothetical protein